MSIDRGILLTCNDRAPYTTPIFSMVRHDVPSQSDKQEPQSQEMKNTPPSLLPKYIHQTLMYPIRKFRIFLQR